MNTKILTFVCVFLISIGLQAQLDRTKAPESGPAPKIKLQKPVEFTLSNGLKVMVIENHKLPRVSYGLTIDNIPAVEGDKKGISILLAALLGNGTTSITKDDFNEEIDFLGANLNFSASEAFASGLSKYSERMLELLADATMNPLFDEAELNKERVRQIEGLKAGEKSVDVVARRVALALAYGTHHPGGEFETEESLNNVTLDDIKEFYKKSFNSENAYLVVIGDVDATTIEKQVKKYFGSWENTAGYEANKMPIENPNVENTQINFIDMPNAVQSNVSVMNTTKFKMSDPDYHAVLIANHILGGGGNGYLFKNLREKHGYTYGAYSGINDNKYVSRFRASAKVRNMVTDSSVVQILNELKRIRTMDVDPQDLFEAKAEYLGFFVLALENPQTISQYALNIKLNNLPEDFYENYLEKINAVTVEDIKRVANKHFKVDNARIVVVGKGSDVLENLEKIGIPIKYFDQYANPVEKPVFSKPIPEGVTAQTVLDNYLSAIGGKDKAETVKTILTNAQVKIEGAPFEPTAEIKQMFPNKESLEMSVEGYGVIFKQKYNGETGYTEQQGERKAFSDKDLNERKSGYSIFPELYYHIENLNLESIVSIDENDVYKIKISIDGKDTYRYYDIKTGLLLRTETTSYPIDSNEESQSQAIILIVDYGDYKLVNDVLYPHQTYISGPQSFNFNISNIIINEGVTDTDFD
ncbi:pitrilysin family protein [Yeosuana sp. MJ-SS3]|uniref:Pitrilysin family protein n=1 Tax=Gilvirhabdus luticola TaxID=3079858 RepID=A0ABU3U3D6_9FLAO|nr:pitrilysin family protein [Yeosuana sp. MJ-SS3]MDU8884927.1 pitrilysin family protein [Yeosuana sp. MJ-SS3]